MEMDYWHKKDHTQAYMHPSTKGIIMNDRNIFIMNAKSL